MEEIEVPTEKLQEDIHHEAVHGHGASGSSNPWISWVALSSALLAACAAVAALLAGHHSNEAMIEQIHASDQWSYYQAKGIKAAVLNTKIALLQGMGKPAPEADLKKAQDYQQDQNEISDKAKEQERSSAEHLRRHQIFAKAVTFFQVAIALSAIAVLMKKRRFFAVSLVFGGVGVVFFVLGLLGVALI